MTEAPLRCCPTDVKPVNSSYVKRGGNFYVAGNGPKALLFVSDIFGEHPNKFFVADMLAEAGFTVVAPMFFEKGEEFPQDSRFDTPEAQAFFKKITNFAPYVELARQGVALLTRMGFATAAIGSVGMCWGGRISAELLKEGLVASAASPHPSFYSAEVVTGVKGPLALLPAKEDPPMLDIKAILESNEFASKNVFVEFRDLCHGFLGARGGFEKGFVDDVPPEISRRTAEAAKIVIDFFYNTLA